MNYTLNTTHAWLSRLSTKALEAEALERCLEDTWTNAACPRFKLIEELAKHETRRAGGIVRDYHSAGRIPTPTPPIA